MTILSDWLYALLPIPMLWSVKMAVRAKATVIIILSLGIFASIATLVRLKVLIGLEDEDDLMFTATNAMVWALVEPGVAIIASSLATMRPLVRAMKIRGFRSTDKAPCSGVACISLATPNERRDQETLPKLETNLGLDETSHQMTDDDAEMGQAMGNSSYPPLRRDAF